MNKLRKGNTLLTILLIVALAGFAWAFYSYTQAKSEIAYLTDPETRQEQDQAQITETVNKISKLMVVPEDEEPVVATVQDAEALKAEQEFFADAQNGDKVIIYKTKAIIYNPTENKIVNVGPVSIQNAPGEPITVEVRNGSETTGQGTTIGDQIGAEEGYEVVAVQNAANTEYQGTTIINLAGIDVSALETEFNTEAVTELPEGELASEAQVVIIVGN